jgi:hypothetical protein
MNEDPEIRAMYQIKEALSSLDKEAVERVLRWAADRFKVPLAPSFNEQEKAAEGKKAQSSKQFQSFDELYEMANPSTNADKVLVAGYWFQEIQGQKNLTSYEVNKQLKDLGHRIPRINKTFDSLINNRPQLVIQVEKGGSTKQARRKYKLTKEGIRKVEQMLEAGKLSTPC